MRKKAKIITTVSALAIISPLIIPPFNQATQDLPVPNTSPVSASLELGRDKRHAS